MTLSRRMAHPANCPTARARRGVVLVLVVFFIFLATALSVLITATSVQLVRTTRSHHESILLRQMVDSAHAWLGARSDWRADVPVVLELKDTLGIGATGRIRMYVNDEMPGVVIVNARLTLVNRERSRTIRLRAPS